MYINLVPDTILSRRQLVTRKRLAAFGLATWVGLVVLVVLIMVSIKIVRQLDLNKLKAKVEARNSVVNSPENKEFRAKALAMQQGLNLLDGLLANQHKFSELNTLLAATIPKTVQLTNVLEGADGKIALEATGAVYDDAAKFVVALRQTIIDAQIQYDASLVNKGNGGAALPQVSTAYFDDVVFNGVSRLDKKVGFSLSFRYYPKYLPNNTKVVK